MGRVLVVEELVASNIPQNIRHIRGLTVKPYIRATCRTTGYDKRSENGEEVGGDEVVQQKGRTRWATPFVVDLQQVETQAEEVKFSLFIRRTLKPDKEVAELKVAMADFLEGVASRTYEMRFVKEKFLQKNAGQMITMKVIARVDAVSPESLKAQKQKRSKIGEAAVNSLVENTVQAATMSAVQYAAGGHDGGGGGDGGGGDDDDDDDDDDDWETT